MSLWSNFGSIDSGLSEDSDGAGKTPRKRAMLLTSAGRRVGLLQCFRQAAAQLGLELDILACDLRPELSAACQLADAAYVVPPATEPDYADRILTLCIRTGATLVVPTIDTELLALAAQRERFENAGIHISISSLGLILVARDKLETVRFLSARGVPVPLTRSLETVLADGWDGDWPVMLKPRHGSSSRGIRVVRARSDLPREVAEPMIVQALLQGAEYTVNMYFDRDARLYAAVPHERLQVRAGEVEKGVTRRIPDLEAMARDLAACLPGPRGALCFQAMRDARGQPRLFEINPRFGGGYPLADQAGAHFARWLLEDWAGLASTASDDWREGVAMLRFDSAIYINP